MQVPILIAPDCRVIASDGRLALGGARPHAGLSLSALPPLRMPSDAFGCLPMASDAFRCLRLPSMSFRVPRRRTFHVLPCPSMPFHVRPRPSQVHLSALQDSQHKSVTYIENLDDQLAAEQAAREEQVHASDGLGWRRKATARGWPRKRREAAGRDLPSAPDDLPRAPTLSMRPHTNSHELTRTHTNSHELTRTPVRSPVRSPRRSSSERCRRL